LFLRIGLKKKKRKNNLGKGAGKHPLEIKESNEE